MAAASGLDKVRHSRRIFNRSYCITINTHRRAV
jgi:hypothetical protein